MEDFADKRGYAILEPILELLLRHGNELDHDYRWGSNPTGYFCILKKPIDFSLVREHFILPASIVLMEDYGCIDYGLGTASIRSA
jgi:hypothetical protein